MWVDCIVYLLGSLIEMPFSVGNFLMQGLYGSMKWLVHTDSTMAQRSSDRWREETKVLQENKLLKTK